MDMNYDENISENKFFQDLVNEHSYVFKRVVKEGWIVCVPRSGSFLKNELLESDVAEHILIPCQDSRDSSRFRTLAGKEATLIDRTITIIYDVSKSRSSRLLFEETFYNDNDNENDKEDGTKNGDGEANDSQEPHKYRVWCMERPLSEEEISEIQRLDVTIVTNLQDAMELLWAEVLDKTVFKELERIVKEFESANKNLALESLHVQRKLIGDVYETCLQKFSKNTRYEEKSLRDEHYCHAVKTSVESYVLYSLQNILRESIVSHTAAEDANFNRTIKNLDELELDELGMRPELQEGISRGKLELSRLDEYVTVLGKAGCIKRAIRYVSPLSSDDLLSTLVSLILRIGLSNWIAQLIFMKLFRFSKSTTQKADEIEFLITSLEAAIEHIKSGALLCDSSRLKIQESTHSFEWIFKQTKDDSFVRRNSYRRRFIDETCSVTTPLCHPLCTCESCEENSRKNGGASRCPVTRLRDDKDRTVLHIAARYGRTGFLEYLLDAEGGDIDVNVPDADGLTPLHYASARGHQKATLLLLHANADPRRVDNRYNTALHLAADYGQENCIKTLLYFAEQAKLQFDVSSPNANGDTPLHHASKWGYVEIARILLEHGAHRDAINKRGQTPLTVAHSKHISHLFSFVRTYDQMIPLKSMYPGNLHTSPTHTNDQTAKQLKSIEKSQTKHAMSRQHLIDRLSIAIAGGDIRLACYYIGFDTSAEIAEKTTQDLCHPLCACERCALTERESSERRQKVCTWAINGHNTVGETALHVATASNSVEIARFLLDAGAHVNAVTKTERRTPLHVAALNDHSIDVAKLLLNCATCDIDATDLNGDTPLHIAIRLANANLVRLLLRHDVNIKLRNLCGLTPLQEMEKKISKETFPSTLSTLYDLLRSIVAQTSPNSPVNSI